MIRPVDAPVSQRFGENPTKHLPWDSWLIQTFGNYQPDGHSGQDYACDVGTPIRAVTSGTVRHIGWMGGSYAENPWWIMPSFAGYVVVIDHGAFIGIYGHCKDGSGRVTAGQGVNEGQVIALSGNTGASTGPHLHFEILPDQYILNSAMYGRINPETLFAGTVTTQSTRIQEWYLMPDIPRDNLLQIAAAVNNAKFRQAIRDEVLGAPIVSTDGKKWPLRAHVQGNTQRSVQTLARLEGLEEVVRQLAAGQGVAIDYEKVEQAVKDALDKSDVLKAGDVVNVDVNVQGQ